MERRRRERETRASRRRNAESDGVARGMRGVLFLRVLASGTPRTRTTTETTTATLWEEVREEERDEGENEVEKKPGNDGRLGTVVRKHVSDTIPIRHNYQPGSDAEKVQTLVVCVHLQCRIW